MIYEDILRELVYMRIYLDKNIGKVSRKEIYKLYRRYLKLYMLLPIKNPEFDKYEDYLMTENRFANLKRVNKEEAEEILNKQKQWAINRYNYYKKISEE